MEELSSPIQGVSVKQTGEELQHFLIALDQNIRGDFQQGGQLSICCCVRAANGVLESFMIRIMFRRDRKLSVYAIAVGEH
jgi:hypothetical protein